MAKWCFDYETGDYKYIERDGFCYETGRYTYNWDDSEYRREEEEEKRRRLEENDLLNSLMH